MDKVFAETYPSGSIKATPTSVTLVNNTAKTVLITVPSDTVWVIQSIRVTNPDNVTRDTYLRLWKEVGMTTKIANLYYAALNTVTDFMYPNPNAVGNTYMEQPAENLVLGPGMTLEIYYAAGGASAGGTDAYGIVVFYRELSLT
jgi:hypothetical protein